MFTRRLTGLRWISLNLARDFRRKKDSRLRARFAGLPRSVCTNLREAWAKRRYEAHFVSKLTDADGENAETETWLDFACDCQYLSKPDQMTLTEKCREVGAMLGSMINAPSSFIL